MIPADIRLFTWVDVEEVLYREQQKPAQERTWPESLVWARAYWDALTLGIRPESQEEIIGWLSNIFAPRFVDDAQSPAIDLESLDPSQAPRRLPVWVEETQEPPPQPRFTPSLGRPTLLTPPVPQCHPDTLNTSLPPVVVFHSFKGGVGRTLTAISLAHALTQRDPEASVLLVDGDLEAPGLSWLLHKRFTDPPVALSDFLALVHSDPDPDAETSIKLTAERLQTLRLDNIFVLPAFRSTSQFTTLEIKPEHLIQGSTDPYRLTTLLARLGETLGVQAVLVDLRAGMSELATGLLMDPRIYRILVTTLSDQSLQGTCQLLSLLGSLTPAPQKEDPIPAIVVTKVPRQLVDTPTLGDALDQLNDAVSPFLDRHSIEEDSGEVIYTVLEHRSELVVLPASWNEVEVLLSQHGIIKQVSPLVDWLPLRASSRTSVAISALQEAHTREEFRRTLKDFAYRLVYAETGNMEDFLTIEPLSNLATDFSTKVPLAVIIGAKGSGKTYTFLQLVRRQNWQAFVKSAIDTTLTGNTYLFPVLSSVNLEESAQELVMQNRQATETVLGLSSSYTTSAIRDHLHEGLQQDLHPGQWRERWLDIVAWSCGFHFQEPDVGQKFTTYLRNKNITVVALIDGLEDLFSDIDSNERQQQFLRALLQDVPEWLRQQPGQPLGILIFVRQDMVSSAIWQNAAQLVARYTPYALKWNDEEALRLVVWIAQQIEIPLSPTAQGNLRTLDFDQLSDALVPLWGRKLGSERSREARSTHWIIGALSAFNGQIQARDLVRFLAVAAEKSLSDDYWQDRVLVPTAIKGTVEFCGQEKIKEIGQENHDLKRIFDQLTKLPEDIKQNPFTQAQTELSNDDIQRLEANGIILYEEGKYYMSALFAQGLGFKGTAGRSRVFSLTRRNRK